MEELRVLVWAACRVYGYEWMLPGPLKLAELFSLELLGSPEDGGGHWPRNYEQIFAETLVNTNAHLLFYPGSTKIK